MSVAVEQFVESVTDALDECGADQTAVESVETAGEQLAEHVEQLRDENDELQEEVESVRDELAEVKDYTAKERAELAGRVTDLEETVESQDDAETETVKADSPDANPGGQADEPTVPDAETPLEETLRFPEAVVEDSLSANQQRARSVARDIADYAEYNHKWNNYSLTAKRLRIVLKAQSDDGKAHHETVKRVRNFLDQLGESEVSVTEDRGGTKRLVFAESLVDRIKSYVAAEAHGGVRGEMSGTGVKS